MAITNVAKANKSTISIPQLVSPVQTTLHTSWRDCSYVGGHATNKRRHVLWRGAIIYHTEILTYTTSSMSTYSACVRDSKERSIRRYENLISPRFTCAAQRNCLLNSEPNKSWAQYVSPAINIKIHLQLYQLVEKYWPVLYCIGNYEAYGYNDCYTGFFLACHYVRIKPKCYW